MCFRYADQMSIDHEVLIQGKNGMTPAKLIYVSNFTM